MTTPTAKPTPRSFHVEKAARTLEIGWSDGHRSVYGFTDLRWLCPCAYCRGEAGLPGWLDSAPTLSDVQTTLTDLQLIGTYAVGPIWADGHATGFYTFDLLRERCPCEGCAAARSARGS